MSPALRRVLAGLLPAVAVSTLLLGCTSSGDGGVGGTDDFLSRGARVTSDLASVTPRPTEYVTIEETSGDAETTCISVAARNAFDTFNAAFTVSYDPALLRFTGWSDAGTCMGTGAVVLSTLVDATTTPGNVVVGLSRNAANTNVGVTCGHFVELCFDVVGEGDGRLTFVGSRQLQDSAGMPIIVEWLGSDLETKL